MVLPGAADQYLRVGHVGWCGFAIPPWLGVGDFMGMADRHGASGRAGGMEESWMEASGS